MVKFIMSFQFCGTSFRIILLMYFLLQTITIFNLYILLFTDYSVYLHLIYHFIADSLQFIQDQLTNRNEVEYKS